MSGSKKGERRGGAKPGAIRKHPNIRSTGPFAPGGHGGPGRPRGAPNKSKFDPEMGVILNKQVPALRKEQELEMYFQVTGKRIRLPKEVMLDAMRYFEETAIDWGQVLQANIAAAGDAEDEEARKVYTTAAVDAELRLREYLTMAVDVAYKVAPYLHPRLSAIMTNPGSGESPMNALALLMRDLDEAGRPARYIDHEPSEAGK